MFMQQGPSGRDRFVMVVKCSVIYSTGLNEGAAFIWTKAIEIMQGAMAIALVTEGSRAHGFRMFNLYNGVSLLHCW